MEGPSRITALRVTSQLTAATTASVAIPTAMSTTFPSGDGWAKRDLG